MVCAVEALAGLVIGKTLQEIVSDFRGFYRLLTSDSQMRWVRTCSEVEKIPSADHIILNSNQDVMGDCLHCCLHQLGPEKGVIHLATAAVLNAVWDLWARAEGKVGQALWENISFHNTNVTHDIIFLQPLWKLLVDMVSRCKYRRLIYVRV